MNDSQTTARPSVILATLAAIAIALAVCATAATVIVASDVTRERGKAQVLDASRRTSVADARASFAAMHGLRDAIDALVQSLGPLAEMDSLTLRRMTHQWTVRADRRAVFVSLPDSLRPTDAPVMRADILNRVLQALSNDSAPADSLLRAVAVDTRSSWLGVWREFARSAPLPPLWGYRDGLPGVHDAFVLPHRPMDGVVYLNKLNLISGWLSLSAGTPRDALHRGLENIAASRHFLDSPRLSDFAVGRSIAVHGARLSRRAAAALADSALLEQLDAFDELVANGAGDSFMALHRAAAQDAADPSSPLAMELFDDEKLPFAVRTEILFAVLEGGCLQTREVLFGFSPEREERLRALADRHAGNPALGPVLQLLPSTARRIRERPESLLDSSRWPTTGLFDFLLPEGVAARAVLCQRDANP